MKTLNIIIKGLCVCLSALPIVLTGLYIALGGSSNIFCIPAVAALPEGVCGYISNYSANSFNFSDFYHSAFSNSSEKEESKNETVNSNSAISASVDEAVIGNIVKKTLSPYTANTKENNVYLNNSTGAGINISSELAQPLSFKVTKSSKPQVLIYHTHTTESYMESEDAYYTTTDEPRTTDEHKNIIAVGAVVAKRLEAAGYSVIHDKTLHDYPGFSGSYGRSAKTVKAMFDKYPSIKIVIDIHRDSISSGSKDKVAPVVQVNGKEAAQVMLVMGSQTGTITDYPNWRQNLRLALKLQYMFETTYPQFARGMLLRSTKYNQNLSTGAFLIEIGSEANTLDQALYSAELVGDTLVRLLESQ